MTKKFYFIALPLFALCAATQIKAINYIGKSFDSIAQHFKEDNAWGLHITLDLQECDAELIRNADAIKKYIIQLCDLIEMKRFGDPRIVHFGEDLRVAGYSMVQLIETSLISGHFANETNTAYIDVFSCKLYDPYIVAEFTKKFFKAKSYKINIMFRK